jgi:hypothetical protein
MPLGIINNQDSVLFWFKGKQKLRDKDDIMKGLFNEKNIFTVKFLQRCLALINSSNFSNLLHQYDGYASDNMVKT